ncbi:hypothetical protein [Streptomyces sp. NPDC059398]|uniref:hypothetical protein n=1 Tax=Streptomyces sp. NPDC059398 TaxID=3346820 RepID=UPI0036AF8A96
MNTFLDYLTVLGVAVLLALPSLVGQARERRIDRELALPRRDGDPDRETGPAPLPPARTPMSRRDRTRHPAMARTAR